MTDQASTAGKPRKSMMSRIPAAFVGAVLKGHSSLGLAFAFMIYLVCLSGTVAVFAYEFQRWERPSAPLVTTVTPQAAQAALEGAIAANGGEVEHAYIYPAMPDLPRLMVSVGVGEDYRQWLADSVGRIVGEASTPWTTFTTDLHTHLHLPHTWGRFLVGLVGVALLSSLISGVLAHPRIFRDAFRMRLGGSRRLQEADLHNRFGVWALPFHFVVSLTGAFLGLTTLVVGVLGFALFQGDVGKVYELFFPPEPAEDARPAPVIDLAPMYAHVAREAPGGRVTFIMFEHPTERGAAASFTVEMPGPGLIRTRSYTFDRKGLIHEDDLTKATIGQKVVAATGPLHFGWFAGALGKIVYGLLGLAMTHLTVSGVNIWLARRRDKGRATPGWERVWATCVWAQPVALAVAALAALVVPGAGVGSLVAIWLAITLGSPLAALADSDASRLSRLGQLSAGILIVAVAILHAALRQGAAGDAIGWVVDAALLVIGIILLLPALRARWRTAR